MKRLALVLLVGLVIVGAAKRQELEPLTVISHKSTVRLLFSVGSGETRVMLYSPNKFNTAALIVNDKESKIILVEKGKSITYGVNGPVGKGVPAKPEQPEQPEEVK